MAHPIENITSNTMENLKNMIDVDTVVGKPVQSVDGVTILPISRVSFGFVTGGGEYSTVTGVKRNDPVCERELPFGGGTGAGVSVTPIGFLIVGQGQTRMVPANHNTPLERLIELLPQTISEIREIIQNSQDLPETDIPIVR